MRARIGVRVVACGLLLMPELLRAQETAPRRIPRLRESTWVRFVTADTIGEGRLAGMAGDTLLVERRGVTTRLPFQAIDSLQRMRNNAGAGALFGAAMLGGGGFLLAKLDWQLRCGGRNTCWNDGGDGSEIALVFGSMIGLALGAIVGALTTEWLPIVPGSP